MATVKGPLLSLSASGEFAGLMEFRTGANGTVVTGIRQVSATRSPAQAAQSQRFANAVAGWQALTTTQKAAWKARGPAFGLNGYQLYLSQYQAQGITPPGQPTIP